VSAGVPATLVVRAPNWLGDTVMAQPALAGLRAAMPEATITLIGRWASLLRGQGIADALLGYPAPAARRRFARALADARPDLALVLPNSFEAARAARLWGARRRVGFDTDARGLYLTDRVPLPEPRRHQVDEYRLLIEALGVNTPAREPRLRVPDDAAAEAEVDALLEDGAPARPWTGRAPPRGRGRTGQALDAGGVGGARRPARRAGHACRAARAVPATPRPRRWCSAARCRRRARSWAATAQRSCRICSRGSAGWSARTRASRTSPPRSA
jgi:hypothetical protein